MFVSRVDPGRLDHPFRYTLHGLSFPLDPLLEVIAYRLGFVGDTRCGW
jgi:hypothetical protein